ncbi:Uncharacterized protein MSYG_2057 [Malassezia sympodialis ATCC 42132]|uniref:Uncharacterized protein n=1 Tax=Malassezia sympodialis (strain ATCC 42132) TaxID=1230383 RepID=A0A1M8A5K2_MALS4|nr:Uncharacterized protein MSYG_2057 [Malassezia sympodialis ATCC 42132]
MAPASQDRLERMRAALRKFLELIDAKATAKNFAHALPALDPVVAEKARLQLVQDLKTAIENDLEALVEQHNLGTRLAELDTLTHEADERQRQGTSDAELKDVWRPDLDIATAIRARVAADQAPRLAALEAELARLQAANAESEARLADTAAQTTAARAEVRDALALIDQLLDSVSMKAPEDEQALRATLDTLLTELGPPT